MIKRLIKRLLMVWQVLRKRDTAPKVVFYHDVGAKYTPMGTDAHVFWRHMRALKVSSLRFKAGEGHQVCFDDGFRGVWDEREKFREFGIRPTVFLAIALVGQPGYLSWDEIRTLQNDYGFNFQCHTWSHQTLAGRMIDESPIEERTDAWFHRELVDSKSELERQLNLPVGPSLSSRGNPSTVHLQSPPSPAPYHAVTSLCFPVGNFSDDAIRRCAAAGYTALYASFPGNIDDEPAILQLPPSAKLIPRNLVQDFSLFDFKLVLNGGMMAFYNRYFALHKCD